MINFAVANAKRCDCKDFWSDARVAEEARLESVYTPKAYPEFESRSLRKLPMEARHIFFGEMAEWSIAAVLKTVEGNTSGGSNPSLSAIKPENSGFCCINTSVPSRN